MRRPFILNGKYFVPVNFLESVPTEQRELENQVAHSKARWNTLLKQESSLEFQLGLKK
jgi:hypothetical protein